MAKAAYLKAYENEIKRWTTETFESDEKLKNYQIYKIVNNKLYEIHGREVSLSYVNEILADLNRKRKAGQLIFKEDKYWSTSNLLNDNSISPEVIPLLLSVQFHLKNQIAKPLTIREARWFSRLSGFYKTFEIFSSNLENEFQDNPNLKKYFILNAISTWSQLYAYRERIDVIAEIEDADYSDMDEALMQQDYKAIFYKNLNPIIEEMIRLAAREDDIDEIDLAHFKNLYMAPSAMDIIRIHEIMCLGHGLGTPDMNMESINVYTRILLTLKADTEQFEKFTEQKYEHRIDMLRETRNICKENIQWIKKNYTLKGFVRKWVNESIKMIQGE
jgi:hypothetical protein